MKTLIKNYNTLPFLMDEFFGNQLNFKDVKTPANIKETNENFIIELITPGFKKEQFKIEYHENLLTVGIDEVSEYNETYIKQEFIRKSFTRSFKLTDAVDVNKINAEYTDGILYINIPKKEPKINEPKTIQIK